MTHDQQAELGKLREAFRPDTRSIWMMPLLVLGPLLLLIIAIAVTVNEINYEPARKGDASNYFACIGLLLLLIGVLAAMWVSDLRAWRASRGIEIKVYDDGFVWLSKVESRTVRWGEIEKLRYRTIYVSSKALKRYIKVLKTIHTTDGKTIKLPETLHLERITELVKASRPDL